MSRIVIITPPPKKPPAEKIRPKPAPSKPANKPKK